MTGFRSSEFYCTKCGQKNIPIQRRVGQYRKGGHLKKLYCINCKEQTNNVEIFDGSEYTKEIFDLEFFGGNFTIDGTRKKTYKEFLSEEKE